MDFYKIGALKVFADLGALIEEDEKNKIKFIDLPTDIIQNNIFNHLKKDKTINKIFYDKDDYYLQNLLCGKLEKMNYIKTNEWDEFKTDLNLDPIKEFININHRCFMKQFNSKK
jgi:hydroxymethylpyrimidine pyrophosphatase-like HAD family hydrolase